MDGGRGGEGERADWLFCQWLWKEALVVLKVKTTPRCPVCHSNQHIEDIDGHRKSYLSCKVSILDNKCNSQCLFFEGFGIKYCEWVLRRWTCTVVWEGMVQHGVNHPPDVMSEPHFMWPCDNKNWIHQAKGERGKGLWLTPRGIEGRGAGKLGWKAERHGKQMKPLKRGSQKYGELAAMVKAMLGRSLAMETKSLSRPARILSTPAHSLAQARQRLDLA